MNTVTATFKNYSAAQHSLLTLESNGFSEEQISVLVADKSKGKSFDIIEATKVPEGAAVGGVAGGIIGAIAAGLTTVGSLVAPGIGVLAVGPIVGAFAGGAAGAATGSLIGALIGFGIPEHEARRYEDEIKNGAVLVAVGTNSHEDAQLVKNIFIGEDAHNIAA
ncbi:MAG: general stress protein [Alphaproteobacteria bacterium]|nr:general stress protein [Alphaproteobacteria bacterium]